MCEIQKLKIFWYELLPYVYVTPCGKHVINRTGVLFDFFRESLAECCGLSAAKTLDYPYEHEQLQHQQAVLSRVRLKPRTVAMPVCLDADFPHLLDVFVPVIETDGLFWVKVKEPRNDAYTLQSISSTALPFLLVIMTMTGYAAVILWLLESGSSVDRQFHRSIPLGMFEAYWCAFISATTIGYGDKVAQTVCGKLFSIAWILIGICLISTFTAIIATMMTSILNPNPATPKPFYDETIGVLEGSFDYLILVKKSANSVQFPDTDALTDALNNGSTFNIVMDKHAYWIYRAKIHQNQSFEFRPGVQNPTSIGYIYNTNNQTLLTCLKNLAMQRQVEVSQRLEKLVHDAVADQPSDKAPDEATMLGPYTYALIAWSIGLLAAVSVAFALIEFIVNKMHVRRSQSPRTLVIEQSSYVLDRDTNCSSTNGAQPAEW